MIIKVETPDAPRPAGHYAQAVIHGETVYVAGQLPVRPHTGECCTGDIEAQTEQVLHNLAAVLAAAGSGLDQVLKTTVYITDIGLWDRVNDVYGRVFGDHRPARAVVPVPELHHGFLVEIEAVAVRRAG